MDTIAIAAQREREEYELECYLAEKYVGPYSDIIWDNPNLTDEQKLETICW